MSVQTPSSSIYPSLPTAMSSDATNPSNNNKKSRQSLSSLPNSHAAFNTTSNNNNNNNNNEEHTIQFPLKHSSAIQDVKDGGARRKRAASVGGAGDSAAAGGGNNGLLKVEELSPRRLSRRMARPRKSILKTVVIPSISAVSGSVSGGRSRNFPRSSPKSSSAGASPRRRNFENASPRASLRGIDHYAHTTAFGHMLPSNLGDVNDDDEYEDESPAAAYEAQDPLALVDRHHQTTSGNSSGGGGGSRKFVPVINKPRSRASVGGGPMTAPLSSAMSSGTMSPGTAARKAERRAMLERERARRKSVTFAAQAHVRMFEKEEDVSMSMIAAGGGGTPTPAAGGGRVLPPSAAIVAASAAATQMVNAVAAAPQQQQQQATTTNNGSSKRTNVFSFASSQQSTSDKENASLSSGGNSSRRMGNANANAASSSSSSSSRRHGRQSSITGIPTAESVAVSDAATAPTAAANVTIGDDDESAMDIETDSEEFEDVDEQELSEQPPLIAAATSTRGIFAPIPSSSTQSIQQTTPTRPATIRGRMSIGKDEYGDDITMDMDITQIVSAGIRPTDSPASTISARSNDDDDDDDDDEDDDEGAVEERTMDFTVALGGFVPGVAPAHAWHDRNSVGYSIAGTTEAAEADLSLDSPRRDAAAAASSSGSAFGSAASLVQGMTFTLPPPPQPTRFADMSAEGDDIMAMEETGVYGGIYGRTTGRQSIAAASEVSMDIESPNKSSLSDADGMDFTIARGGIFNAPQSATGRIEINVTSPSNSSGVTPADRSVEQQDDGEQMPGFARPTAASQAKHVFSPTKPSADGEASTSSTPQAASPQKRAMNRAVFGSPSKKTLNNSQNGAGAIVASPPKNSNRNNAAATAQPSPYRPGRTADTPERQRSSMAPPARRMSASPAKSLFHVRTSVGAGSGLSSQPVEPEWAQQEFSTITLATFLDMTGVQFMENMATGVRRKSTIGGGLGPEVLARMAEMDAKGERDYALHDYARAMVSSVHFNMYSWGCNQMRKDIENGHAELEQYDHDISEDNPPVIREYLAANDEEKGFFELTIKNLKTNAHLIAREKWYDWRQSIVKQIKPAVSTYLEGFKDDQSRIQNLRAETSVLLPNLRERLAALQRELEEEKAAVAEIEDCDQEELKELKAGIAEQSLIINTSETEKAEQEQKLASLKQKLRELTTQKKELLNAVAGFKREIDHEKGFSEGDLRSLQEELRSLEHLHLWRIRELKADTLVMDYDSEISLTFSCANFKPALLSVEVAYTRDLGVSVNGNSLADATSGLYRVFHNLVKKEVQRHDKLAPFVRRVGQIWSAAQRLRVEYKLVCLNHPVTFQFLPGGEASASPLLSRVQATATLMLPSIKSKVRAIFTADEDTLGSWPHSIADMDVKVELVYGVADASALTRAAVDCLNGANAEGYLGVLMMCCTFLNENV